MPATHTPDFGDLLRRFRIAAGLTQEALAERARLSATAISALERGTRQAPYRDTVRLLADALGLGLEARTALSAAAVRPRAPARDADSRAPTAAQLPSTLTSFVGRESELTAVGLFLAEGRRLVTLTGPGGVGKTRLAIEVARGAGHTFPDGIWFIDLAPVADAALVPQAVASVLAVHDAPGRSFTQSFITTLRDRRVLLLLDNCEHVLDACADFVAVVLRSCPHVGVLATSRGPLHLKGEQHYPLLPLPVPPEDAPPALATETPLPAAMRLFLDRARAVQPEFVLSSANVSAVIELCRRLDGLPLAIELVAPQVRVLSPHQIVPRLHGGLGTAVGAASDVEPRHRTLRALIDWSYDLLNEPERVLLRRLAVFVGGCDLEAVEAVCSGPELEVATILDVLAALVDKALVVAEPRPPAVRFRLLESIRTYGLERLAECGEVAVVRRAHAEHYARFAERADLHGPARAALTGRLALDDANVRAAMTYCQGTPDGGLQLLRFAAALGYFWFLQGHTSEGRAWCSAALTRPEAAANPALRARVLFSAGQLAWDQEDLADARALLEASAADARQAGDRRWLARALYTLGDVLWHAGDREGARIATEESAACASAAGHAWELGLALQRLGLQAFRLGDVTAARGYYQQSLAQLHRVADPSPAAYVERHLGYVAQAEGRYAEALRHMTASLAVNRAIDDLRGVAGCLAALAGLAVAQGQPALAARLSGAMAAMLERGGATALNPGDRSLHEGALATIRAALDADTVAALLTEGHDLSVDAALVLASTWLGGCTDAAGNMGPIRDEVV